MAVCRPYPSLSKLGFEEKKANSPPLRSGRAAAGVSDAREEAIAGDEASVLEDGIEPSALAGADDALGGDDGCPDPKNL